MKKQIGKQRNGMFLFFLLNSRFQNNNKLTITGAH